MAFDELTDHDVEQRLAQSPDLERAIRCAACRAGIASPEARIERGGAHRHVRDNPHGVRFEIGCFSPADGCRAIGEPTRAWTWFPGCAWQVALCRACAGHLGWRFVPSTTDSGGAFFGLILERLTYP